MSDSVYFDYEGFSSIQEKVKSENNKLLEYASTISNDFINLSNGTVWQGGAVKNLSELLINLQENLDNLKIQTDSLNKALEEVKSNFYQTEENMEVE